MPLIGWAYVWRILLRSILYQCKMSRDIKYLKTIILQTVANPNQRRRHQDNRRKSVLLKRYPEQIGIHGSTGRPCYTIVVILRQQHNLIQTNNLLRYTILTYSTVVTQRSTTNDQLTHTEVFSTILALGSIFILITCTVKVPIVVYLN